MHSKGYGGHFVCSINISPLGCPAEKMKIQKFIIQVNLVTKLFILCEILSLSRYDNFKSQHGAIGHYSPSNLTKFSILLRCTCALRHVAWSLIFSMCSGSYKNVGWRHQYGGLESSNKYIKLWNSAKNALKKLLWEKNFLLSHLYPTTHGKW